MFDFIRNQTLQLNIDGKEIFNRSYYDLEDVKKIHKGTPSNKNRTQFNTDKERELNEEWKFTNYYADLRQHQIFLARCPQYNACKSCDEFYETAELPAEFQDKLLLPNKQYNGALWYEPEQDPKHPGHFKTYLAQREEFKTDRMKQIKPDSNISDGPALRCQEPDCLTTLRSKAMTKRHYSKLHNKNAPGDKERVYVCKYKGCNTGFSSNWYLNQHKVAEGHQKVNETRDRKKKQTFIESNSKQSDSEFSSRTRSSRQKKNQSVTLSVAKSRRSKRSRN